MIFRALLIGVMAATSLAMPHRPFLHEVDLPGDIPADSNKTEPVPPSVATPSSPGASVTVKEEVGGIPADSNKTEPVPPPVATPSSPGASGIVKREIGDIPADSNKTEPVPPSVATPSSPGASVTLKEDVDCNKSLPDLPAVVAPPVEASVTAKEEIGDIPADSNKTEPVPPSVATPSRIVKREVNAEGDGLDGVAIPNETDKVNVSVTASKAALDLATKQEANVSTPSSVSSPESANVEPSTTANNSEPGPALTPVDPFVASGGRRIRSITETEAPLETELGSAQTSSSSPETAAPLETDLGSAEISGSLPETAAPLETDLGSAEASGSVPETAAPLETDLGSAQTSGSSPETAAPLETNLGSAEASGSSPETAAPLRTDLGSAQTSSSSPAASVENTVLSSSPADVVEASSSPVNSDLLPSVRLFRSIIEQADMSADVEEQSTPKSVKCQCPSGECSGEMCLLMDLTSIASSSTEVPTTTPLVLPGNQTRDARSVPEQAVLDVSTESTVNTSVSAVGTNISNNASEVSTQPGIAETTQPGIAETKAPVAESHIQKIQPRPARSIPDETTAGISISPDQDATNQQVSESLDPKSVQLNDGGISEDPKLQQNDHADATIVTTANSPDQMKVHRRKRSPQETLDDLITLSDEEMAPSSATTEPTTTLKLAADTPEGFSAEPMLLERSRRLYRRSVPGAVVADVIEPKSATATQKETTPEALETGSPLPTVAPSTVKEVERVARQDQVNPNAGESTSTGAAERSAVSPSITGADQTSGKAPKSANTNQVPATNGGASVSAQASSASPDVPATSSEQVPENDSKAELPEDILPNGEGGLKNEENELARTRYVHSADDGTPVEATSSAASLGANQVLAKANVEPVAEAEISGVKTSNTPAEPLTKGGEPLDGAVIPNGEAELKHRHTRVIYSKPKESVTSSTAKADVSSASAVTDGAGTAAMTSELPKQNEANATEVVANSSGVVANSSGVVANSSGVAANATEVAANSTVISTNATKIVAGEPQNVTKPSTLTTESAAASQSAAVTTESAAASQSAAVTTESAAASQSVSNPPELVDNVGGVIGHRKFFRPMVEENAIEKQTTSRGERKIMEKQEAAREQEQRRLGKSTDEDDSPDLGPLDIRTMGGNQLDIDPVDSSATFDETEHPRSSHLMSSAYRFLPQSALLSSFLAAYLSTY